jgi:diguanylate cyclase (GGDEF)-like protein
MRNQLRVQKRELAEALERNNLLARQDELTGLPNRRHALEMMAYEERRAARELVRPSVCLLDIDHFKAVNDTYGHPAGDDVLRLVARNAPNALRTPDLMARWGGEEFLLVMPQTSADAAVLVIERLRVALAQPHLWNAHPHLQVTFSAGVAIQHEGESMEETVARADAALYKAKQSGRNCTVSAEV